MGGARSTGNEAPWGCPQAPSTPGRSAGGSKWRRGRELPPSAPRPHFTRPEALVVGPRRRHPAIGRHGSEQVFKGFEPPGGRPYADDEAGLRLTRQRRIRYRPPAFMSPAPYAGRQQPRERAAPWREGGTSQGPSSVQMVPKGTWWTKRLRRGDLTVRSQAGDARHESCSSLAQPDQRGEGTT